jgi:hypothetical protein
MDVAANNPVKNFDGLSISELRNSLDKLNCLVNFEVRCIIQDAALNLLFEVCSFLVIELI